MATDIIYIEDAQIMFRNFRGEEGKYNKVGQRNFVVLIDEETAHQMDADGWNVKKLEPREGDDPETEPKYFLPIELRYDVGRPPRVVLITSRGRRNLEEQEVSDLDYVDILHVDMSYRGSHWDVNGKTGIKAYLQSIYVTIEEDYLEAKYAELPQQA